MKTIGTILLLALMNIGVVVAQEQGPGQRQGRANRGERIDQEKANVLAKVTDLSEDQKMIFEVIYDDYKKANEETFAGFEQGDREGIRTKFTKIREDKDLAIKELFTEQQFELYKEVMDAAMQQRRRRTNG